jgi:hypothetical protein
MGPLTVTVEEMKVMNDRLAELGLDAVKAIAAADGFPQTWRLHVLQWIARSGKVPLGPQENTDEQTTRRRRAPGG